MSHDHRQRETFVSIDAGTSAIKAVVVSHECRVLHHVHFPAGGDLSHDVAALLTMLAALEQPEAARIVAVTGSRAAQIGETLGVTEVNEVMSALYGGAKCEPAAGAILDVGSEHARFLRVVAGGHQRTPALRDFRVNTECFAGAGSFLAKEASRLGMSLDNLDALALRSTESLRVAGRCAVFAKTDLVHHAQSGASSADVAGALCRFVATSVHTSLLAGSAFTPPLLFIGGVARNRAIGNALRELLCLDEASLVVPEGHLYVSALGAHLFCRDQGLTASCSVAEAGERIRQVGRKPMSAARVLLPLTSDGPQPLAALPRKSPPSVSCGKSGLAIGVDVGSTSTNLVALDSQQEVAYAATLPTAGRPVEAVIAGLREMALACGDIKPRALGVTGSGRRLIAALVGADAAVNEITAHASGAASFFSEADTVFDIGGQDAKFIRIENGAVTDFAMNKVCSAGTGSFLEEIAEELGVDVRTQFSSEAFQSQRPADLGERCTVFMSSELRRKQEEGFTRPDLLAGLAYSVAQNYLSRVVGRRKIGRFISFQGGVAGNQAVRRALERLLELPIHVHQHHEIAGAVGAALMASKRVRGSSQFGGFDRLAHVEGSAQSFACARCPNVCRIRSAKDSQGETFYMGADCDRYDAATSPTTGNSPHSTDLLEERRQALEANLKPDSSLVADGECVGIPYALLFHELLPFWSAFLNQLGVSYRLSGPTTSETIRNGSARCPSAPCLPVKIAHGHCEELIAEGVRTLFCPSVTNLSFETAAERLSHVCPAVQSWPFVARSWVPAGARMLTPTVRFSIPRVLQSDIVAVGRLFDRSPRESRAAFESALASQKEFYRKVRQKTQELLGAGGNGGRPVVVLGRPYTLADRRTYSQLRRILNSLNLAPVPLDGVRTAALRSNDLDGMYWYYGKRFLQVAKAVKDNGGVPVIHLSNFGCGADSFLIHFLRRELAGHPFLELQLDEHHEFTGVYTRVEAFVDSLDHRRSAGRKPHPSSLTSSFRPARQRHVLIPQMSDHAWAVAAAFRACGVSAEVLPVPDQRSVSLGKQVVAGEECFPCAAVMGDMLRYLQDHPEATERAAFFMVAGDGPCRLGQYPFLQRLALDELGFESVPVLNASQDPNFYRRLQRVSSRFQRCAWNGLVAADLLGRKWRECRPYSRDRAHSDQIYHRQLRWLAECAAERRNLREGLRSAFDALDDQSVSPQVLRPVIAVLGENYVRCNRATGQAVADLLEELGAEVWFPSLYEWIYYTNWTARLHCRYERDYRRLAQLQLIDLVQHWDERRLRSAVRGRLRNVDEPPVSEVFSLSAAYVPRTLEGETLLSVGRTIDFYRKKAAGVIHIVPFGCMVGSIVEGLSERVSRDLLGFPIMTIHVDGPLGASIREVIEAFWFRALDWKKRQRERP
jgi:predicted CoA-substrate-specific enzyme activase